MNPIVLPTSSVATAAVSRRPKVIVVGGGPAGLMAAEVAAAAGLAVDLYDTMPSVGRKLLLAGRGGLNITHTEPRECFEARYGPAVACVADWLDGFGAEDLRAWAHGLGIDTFVGTSGRVFPSGMKAGPLLRAWLHRLRGLGVVFHVRHRWIGWRGEALVFDAPGGTIAASAPAIVLALGGASWPQLGSDGAWVGRLRERGVAVDDLRPANCGFECDWSERLRIRHAGDAVKNVDAWAGDARQRQRGEFVVSAYGIEGGLVYACARALRESVDAGRTAALTLDLAPDLSATQLAARFTRGRAGRSLANRLRGAGLAGAKAGLLRELAPPQTFRDAAALARAVKALSVPIRAARPIDQAISSAGGVRLDALDWRLMLRAVPGVFCAGEMLDWEAPTGGYLLTACFASGRQAGLGVVDWLRAPVP